MKNIYTKYFLISIAFLIFLCGKNYAQMPPHPSLLDRISRGEQSAPYALSNINLIRSKGVDEPWAAPELQMLKKQNTFSRSFGPADIPSGSWKALAILVQFSDKPSQVNAGYFDNLLFGQSTGTLRDYYNKVSYGNLDIVTVNLPSAVGWVTAPQTYSYYVNGQNGEGSYPQNTQKLTEDIVNLVNPLVDFAQYDNDGDGYVDALFIIHSGRGAEYTGDDNDIWSHAWVISSPQILDGVNVSNYSIEPEYWVSPGDMTCGVFAHEMGHAAFGLPDLYDTDYSSEGLGNWSLMAGGSWNGALGNSPAFPDAWSHSQMGYLNPTIVSSNITGQTINNIESTPEAYFLQNSLCGTEYFLVENRQKTSYDTYLPGSGLCIYHIDDAVNNNNHEWYPGNTSSGHYHVAMEQADGLWNLEKKINRGDAQDPFPGSTNNINFDNSAIPDSKNYDLNETDIGVSNILSSSNYTVIADLYIQKNMSEKITITYPSGGEVFVIGSNPVITYTSIGTSGYLNIDYSTDGGISWNIISTNQPDDGDYKGWIVPNTPSTNCKIRISDVDGYPSVISKGLFIIPSNEFTEQISISLIGLYRGSAIWGDYDNDDDLDILITGCYDGMESVFFTKIYRNNGDNTFTEQTSISLTGVYEGRIAWGDYNNDGYLDILLTGYDPSAEWISRIYRNNGDGTFTEQTSISLTGVNGGSAVWGDYDNDGFLDILLTGAPGISKIYHNNRDNSFTEQTSISLTATIFGSAAWGDYDNDAYLDILLTGYGPISKLYRNNADNTFTEQTSISLAGVGRGATDWGDYDNDGYLDILLTGNNADMNYSNPVSKIYHNNGDNTFTEQTLISLTGVSYGSTAWGDYDNDGDMDILLTGNDGSSAISKIYRNNGNNSVTETSIYLTGVSLGSGFWGDYDNDGDLDVLLMGFNNYGKYFSKIYRNNIATPNTPPSVPSNLKAVVNGSNVTFSWDKSADNETPQNGLTYNLAIGRSPGACNVLSPMSDLNTSKRRIVSMGNTGHCNSWTIKGLSSGKYYWTVQAIDNCFAGSDFTETQSFTIQASGTIIVTYPAGGEAFEIGSNPIITYSSLGNSGFVNLDLSTDGGITWDTIATNQLDDGDYRGWIVPNSPSANCKIRVADVDGNPSAISNGVFRIGAEEFSKDTSLFLSPMEGVSAAWGDYDNDNDLDILLTGVDSVYYHLSKIYRNNGNNTFSEQTSILLEGGNLAVWGDYDNDGDLDILSLATPASKIFRNNGDNTFTEQTSINNIIGVYNGSADWGDYDNDGDLDILLTGMIPAPYPEWTKPKVYRNNGDNTFTDQAIPFDTFGSVSWGDYDNDGDLDILLNFGGSIEIYSNNGDNVFTKQAAIELDGSGLWGDYDNDGDLDIISIGSNILKVYQNNGDNTFSDQITISPPLLSCHSVFLGDYDNDGDFDILLLGLTTGRDGVAIVYKNHEGNTFTEQTSILLTHLERGSAAWADYDNDDDLDIILTGNGSKLYRNNIITKNTPPSAPSNLKSAVNGNDVTFSWDKSSDTETPQNGLHYNLVIGTTPNGVDKLSPMSNKSIGYRRVVRLGNSQTNSWTIKNNLLVGHYYWSVQAIDNCYAGSAFAPEQNIPLPVELTSFIAEIMNNSIKLKWQTATEINNYGFEIERKHDKKTIWDNIGFVEGSGNSNSPKEYSFIDKKLFGGTKFSYRLKQIDHNGTYDYSKTVEVELPAPKNYELYQNYPNPFNPSTIISWQSPVSSWQTLKVYDVLGNEIATLVDEYKPAGSYEVEFQSAVGNRQLASGIYYYQLRIGDFIQTKKMILLR